MAQAKQYVDDGLEVHQDGLEVDRANEGLQHGKPRDADGLQYHSWQPTSGDEKQTIERRDGNTVPCGLSALLFAILVSVITAVVVGAAVGGGVGGALSGPDYRDK